MELGIYGLLLAVAVVLVVVAVLVWAALRTVPEHKRLVVFRFGRFAGVHGPGLVLIIPFLDQAVPVDLREQVRALEGQTATTRDNERVVLDVVWSYQIVDPARSVLEVQDLEVSSQDMAAAALRTVAGHFERYDLLHDRGLARAKLHSRLVEIVEPWGVEVRDVEIREVRRG
jgi:regulator of protease activity HflC (stomatin/prohibitin superfamily)